MSLKNVFMESRCCSYVWMSYCLLPHPLSSLLKSRRFENAWPLIGVAPTKYTSSLTYRQKPPTNSAQSSCDRYQQLRLSGLWSTCLEHSSIPHISHMTTDKLYSQIPCYITMATLHIFSALAHFHLSLNHIYIYSWDCQEDMEKKIIWEC